MSIFIVACLGCMLCFILFILSGLFKHSLLPIKISKELPKVSVVIAARNEEMVLPSLIQDLVNQEYPLDKLEVIIVNDRSTDATKEILTKADRNYALIKMTSGEVRKIDSRSMATIGVLSNPDQKNIKIGKAGRSRWLGVRPHTRGVVKNPVDHPHGGGEGKTSGGRDPVSPWGQSAKGLKTRKNKKTNKFIISRRK